jgi:hypothetical protein
MSGLYADGWQQLLETRDRLRSNATRPPAPGTTAGIILAALTAAAAAGDACPTTDELVALTGVPTKSAVLSSMTRLKKAGHIDIQRVAAGRLITVLATGKVTLSSDRAPEVLAADPVAYSPFPEPKAPLMPRWSCDYCNARSDAPLEFSCPQCLPMRRMAA